jgi:6-bladed beta-propeller protein
MTKQNSARLLRAALIVTLAPLWAACSADESSEGTWAGTVADSAGVRVVHNPAEGLWNAQTAWSLSEEVSIGGLSGEVEYEFGQITGVDVDSEGDLYVADLQAQEVRVFNPSGVYLRTIGKPGSGPGEIGAGGLVGVFVIGDEVLVPDMANARINRFTLEGEPLDAATLDVLAGIPIRWDRVAHEVIAQRRTVNTDPSAAEDFVPTGDVVVTMNRETPEILATLPVGQSMQFTGGGIPQIKIFDPEPVWDAGDDGGILVAMNSAVRIEVWSPDGALQHVISRERDLKPVTERDQRIFKDVVAEQVAQQGAPPAAIQQFLASMQFAEYYPAFATLAVGPSGSVWAQRIRSGDEIGGDEDFNPQDLGSNEWDVYNSEGHYLGVFTFPGKFQPIKVIGDRFYGIHRDELDVPSVKVYRVIAGAEAPS